MYVQQRDRDGGLGFPVGLVIMGVSAAVGAIQGRGKDEPKEAPISRIEARNFVREQYQELLGRFPAPGDTGYEDQMVAGRCDASCVREGILNSVEYANRKNKQLQQTAPPSANLVQSLIGPTATDAYGPVGGGASALMQYAPYVIGGVVLLSVLRK